MLMNIAAGICFAIVIVVMVAMNRYMSKPTQDKDSDASNSKNNKKS